MVVFTVAWVNLKVFQRGGTKQQKAVFVFSHSLSLNRLEPQSNKSQTLTTHNENRHCRVCFYTFRGTTFVETAVCKKIHMFIFVGLGK